MTLDYILILIQFPIDCDHIHKSSTLISFLILFHTFVLPTCRFSTGRRVCWQDFLARKEILKIFFHNSNKHNDCSTTLTIKPHSCCVRSMFRLHFVIIRTHSSSYKTKFVTTESRPYITHYDMEPGCEDVFTNTRLNLFYTISRLALWEYIWEINFHRPSLVPYVVISCRASGLQSIVTLD